MSGCIGLAGGRAGYVGVYRTGQRAGGVCRGVSDWPADCTLRYVCVCADIEIDWDGCEDEPGFDGESEAQRNILEQMEQLALNEFIRA
jgi:hypothetical protein